MASSEDTVRIMFVGDINLGEYYTSFGHGPKSYIKHSDPFKLVKPIFEKADIVVGNLEAPITEESYIKGEPESEVLRGNPEDIHILTNARFKILQIANNHSVQHGPSGFHETKNLLESHKIKPVGINGQDPEIIIINNQIIGFIAASDVPDNTYKDQTCYQVINNDFLDRVEKSIRKVDHLFVLLHWGLESSTSPMPYQKALSNKLSDIGVRGVIGQHPHLFYPIWQRKKSIIAPSLGNFLFDLCWDDRLLKTGILDLELKKESLSWKVWPVTIKENGCLPKPEKTAKTPSATKKTVDLYDLRKNMNGEQKRKIKYFLSQIHKGDTLLKLKFFTRKLIKKTKSAP